MRNAILLSLWLCATAACANAADVVTQHNDNQRTGWNPLETTLTASNVTSASFGLLRSVTLDDQVDAQPLVLAKETIGGASRTVAYVVTENNTVYAIDTATGTVLVKKSLGTPVPRSSFGNCNNNAAHQGIMATPAIDRTAGRLYVMAYSISGSTVSYRIHALSLTTLSDAIPSVLVTATHVLTNGTTYSFQASKMRQRAGLLEANGNIYAAFTSFCDAFANTNRGWVLGWNASTLKPLAANELTNKLAPSSTDNFFLSTIWMSGNGLAASPSGDLFFATGNSKSATYSSTNNLSESIIRLSNDLTTVKDFFTPSNVNTLDGSDGDISSGGVLLIPSPSLATAMGKDGRLFLLSQSSLGKFNSTDKNLQTISLGQHCWCAENYFKGADGVGRVVTTARVIITWKVGSTSLTKDQTTHFLSSGQDPGFFASVSSNGTTSGSAVIWAVSRPTTASPATVLLYAFNAANGAQLFSASAGTWPNTTGNANLVPTVANGQVLVASFKQLAIFGPKAKGAAPVALLPAAQTVASQALPVGNEVSGWIDGINGNVLTLRKRDGGHVTVDISAAVAAFQAAPIFMEEPVTAIGTTDAQGVLQAQTVVRAKDSRDLWPPDQ
jgi:hypothetical protein